MQKTLMPFFTLAIGLAAATAAAAFECKVCHSKNPRMVAMHTALRGENCFGCHKVGDRLMGKREPKDTESLLRRRVSDAECVRCHGKKQREPGL
ncbi:cytochrome C [Geobacter sp. FeAm09]|uniref:cytochrome c3 family protein n=1 Tax=Geobacter sp. FeAm09 TaxID=2597769 RepID=UPI0011EC6B93|nr:cytochrome c3 family protein [Geobacter sp. FeAm09]QEM69563.1 cytochrome C [Geobacter sp. FeAm09]